MSGLVDSLREKLAGYDRACEPCPARKEHLGERLCPKCHASPSEGCGLDARASHDFINAIRNLASEGGGNG